MPESGGEKTVDIKPNVTTAPFERPDKFPPGKENISPSVDEALGANRADSDADLRARKQRTADEIDDKHRRMEEVERRKKDFLIDSKKIKK